MKARMVDNQAVDVCEDPTGLFHPSIVAQFVTVPDQVRDGWRWDEEKDEWTPPQEVSEQVTQGDRKLSRLGYMRRFTVEEEAAIRMAAESDPVIKVILARLDAATFVDLDDPAIQEGLAYLVSKGLLTANRALEIQTAPIELNERPQQ